MKKKVSVFCYICMAFIVLFAIHRAVVLGPLGGAYLLESTPIPYVTASFLSDAWGAILIIGTGLVIPWKYSLRAAFLLALVLLTCHVPYVAFFKSTFRAFHGAYLVDADFLRSSRSELFRGDVVFQFIALSALFAASWKWLAPALTWRSRLSALVALTACGAAFNAGSLKLVRRYDLPATSVTNPLVSLLGEFAGRRPTLDYMPSADDESILCGEPGCFLRAGKKEKLSILANDATDVDPVAQGILQNVRTSLSGQETVHVMVIVLESLRARESALFFEQERPSRTPKLDKILGDGVVFRSAFSTGEVTRAGVESTNCNILSSWFHNAMRDEPSIDPRCAVDILGRTGRSVDASFLHGGYLGFDGQMAFWTRKGFQVPFDILKLPKELPRTDWGLSDKVLFDLTREWWREHRSGLPDKGRLTWDFLLTVSNHTAFVLPPDASEPIVEFAGKDALSPYEATVRYADEETAHFLEWLKETPEWKRTMVFLVGDHGVREPIDSRGRWLGFGSGKHSDLVAADALSHVFFGMTGGLVERAVHTCRNTGPCLSDGPVAINHAVSQADVLPTVWEVLRPSDSAGPEKPLFLGSTLAARSRKWDVFSDFGDSLYLPFSGELVKKVDLHSSLSGLSRDARLAQLRAYSKAYVSTARMGLHVPEEVKIGNLNAED